MADSPSRVFTIPSSAPFLPTLAMALVEGRLVPGFVPRQDPLLLSTATVYLPTRRAARVFGFAILNALGTEAALLPRILPLGDVDEEELVFAEEKSGEERWQAISSTNRRLILAKLVLAWARALPAADPLIATTPTAALALSDELVRVLDDLILAGASFKKLNEAIPENLDQYWKLSYDFLRIVREYWPAYLAEKKLVDPTTRGEELLARETVLIRESNGGPVIAAGSTGTLPAVANLLATIAHKSNGAVVLPGLDQNLDDPSFDLIGGNENVDPSQGHPQYGLKRLLDQLQIERADVVELGDPEQPAREKLLSEAFRPAATTDRWQQNGALKLEGDPLSGFTIIEAADPREEALAIAVSLREALESKEAHAALITPDRALARRVAAELTRWGIVADDSAGIPLSETEAGTFARLTASVVAENLAPGPLIAFLRHPLSRFIEDERAIDALEQGVLRGPRPAPGAEELIRAISAERSKRFHKHDPKARLLPADWEAAIALAERIGKILSPLSAFSEVGRFPFRQILEAHRTAIFACGLNLETSSRPDVRTLVETIGELGELSDDAFDLTLSDYAEVFAELIRNQTLRPLLDPQSHIRILGPLEARLVAFDRVVLGGLNEGNWPPNARTDAFLNRPMRRELGLNLPERRIGLSAHDFVQAAGSREVVLTRARRQAGAETVASRFWQRIEAVAPQAGWNDACQRGNTLLRLARGLDEVGSEYDPTSPPTPRPPVSVRPSQLSVTEIRDLVRDPYTIYAKHILRLAPLEDIDADPGAAEKGIILHEALARFTQAFPEKLPQNLLTDILKFGEAAFEPYRRFPGASAIWWPRFERVARWFAEEEINRRKNIQSQRAEIFGKIVFDVAGKPFTLTARADRIDLFTNGSIGIYDYKTGVVPTIPQAVTGLEPQLPLEAAIASFGGFEKVPAGSKVGDIAAIKLSGGNPPGVVQSLNPESASTQARKLLDRHHIATCDALGEFALARLKNLLTRYADQETPYRSVPRPKWRLRYGRYDHLARIKEWSDSSGADE
jgi:ATP-dependent helicase/nuclease subunit B